jgi:hypothetical protein
VPSERRRPGIPDKRAGGLAEVAAIGTRFYFVTDHLNRPGVTEPSA